MAETAKLQEAKQPLRQEQAENAANESARAADVAVRRGTEAVQQGGRATSEAVRWAGDAANEIVHRNMQAVADAQRQIVQDAAQRFQEMSRKVAEAAQGTTENVRRLMVLPHAAEGGSRDLQQGVAGLVEGVVQTNLRVVQELFRLSNPAPIIELQQRFVREYTDTLLQNSTTLVRAMRRTADETLRPLEAQIEQRDQANQDGMRFRNAAE
jgi:hypothetical protein